MGIWGPEPASDPRTRGLRGPRVQPELPGAALALLPVGAEPSSVLNSPSWAGISRSAFPRGSQDVQSRDRPVPGCGSVPFALP